MAEYDGDLKNHLQHRKKNNLYVSKTVENETIAIIGDIIHEKASSTILNDSVFFSIIGNEVIETHPNKRFYQFLCVLCHAMLKNDHHNVY